MNESIYLNVGEKMRQLEGTRYWPKTNKYDATKAALDVVHGQGASI